MSKINVNELDIQHDTGNGRIYFEQKDAENAALQYELDTTSGSTVINFTSTFVPEAVQEMGIGTRLVEEGMRLADKEGYKVKASCPFVKNYMNEEREFAHLYQQL
ncbi:MAG: GNAT family N-acetyltransferase [Bacteroidota bacterium]